MSQQDTTATSLPALRHTAPAAYPNREKKRGTVYRQHVFSLDGCLRTLPNRVAVVPSELAMNMMGVERSASPAEALLAANSGPPVAVTAPQGPSPSTFVSIGAEAWRSRLLHCETELRELVARGVRDPPSLDRTLKVMELFDGVCQIVQSNPSSSFMGEVLRLFRVEFCRAIFVAHDADATDRPENGAVLSSTTARGGGYGGGVGAHAAVGLSAPEMELAETRTYFDEVESLRRAKAYLAATLANGASGESLLLLQRQLEDKDDQLTWYEGELERLRRQYDQVSDECWALRQKNEAITTEAAATQRRLQQDIQTLHVENKDVQLQLFRLRKQMAGGKTNQLKEAYRMLKLNKMVQTQCLFNEGDERVVLLVLLGQVESRVNEVLDSYDQEYVLTPEAGRRDLQQKMAENVVVLLEDMHYCEVAYRRLVGTSHTGKRKKSTTAAGRTATALSSTPQIPLDLVHTGSNEEAPDETDGYVAILFDQRVYEHFVARHAVQDRLEQYAGKKSSRAARTRSKKGKDSMVRAARASGPSSRLPSALSTKRRQSHDTELCSTPFIVNDEREPNSTPDASTQPSGAGEPLSGRHASLDSHLFSPLRAAASASFTVEEQEASLVHSPCKQPRRSKSALSASSNSDTTAAQSLAHRAARARKAEWVANVLGSSANAVAFTVPRPNSEQRDVVVVHKKSAEVMPVEAMMKRVLRHPMADLGGERFLSTVELFTGEDPVQQKLLCRVNYVDPSLPIQVPDATNFVKVKYAHAANAIPTAEQSERIPPGTLRGAAARAPDEDLAVYRGNPNIHLFTELGSKGLVEGNPGLQYRAGAVSSTTAFTVAFQRLNPLSPNRAPEWLLYQQIFGAYRSLTPRMIEVTTVDHLMACASERFFIRMEYRYDECLERAAQQCTNMQLRQDMAERLFKDMYVLSDFQEALVDELEARYGYAELVAKTLYEILCFLDAVAEKDSVLAAYLDVIRGFTSPTQIHFMSYMLYHLSYCWPSVDPTEAAPSEDVRTVFDYLYRNATVMVPIHSEDILKDYKLASRSAPLTFMSVRQFMASAMIHLEEPLLMHLHGRLHVYTQREATDEVSWDVYESVIAKCGRMKEERRSLVRFLSSSLGVNRPASASLHQLTYLAASAWCSNLWE